MRASYHAGDRGALREPCLLVINSTLFILCPCFSTCVLQKASHTNYKRCSLNTGHMFGECWAPRNKFCHHGAAQSLAVPLCTVNLRAGTAALGPTEFGSQLLLPCGSVLCQCGGCLCMSLLWPRDLLWPMCYPGHEQVGFTRQEENHLG